MPQDSNESDLKPVTNDSPVVNEEYAEHTLEYFVGQYPHPSILAGYENVMPGMVNRIVTLSEKEQSHRHNIETIETKAQIDNTKIIRSSEILGQVFGFVLFLCVIGFAGYSLNIGKQEVAISTIVVALISGTTVFVTGRQKPEANDPLDLNRL